MFSLFPIPFSQENKVIEKGFDVDTITFWEKEIYRFLHSPERRDIVCAENYYNGDQEILRRKIKMPDGKNNEKALDFLPNHRIVDNQYAKCVDEKKNYLISRPITITTRDEEYGKILREYFNKKMHKTLNRVARNSIDKGKSYLYPYYDQNHELKWKRFNSWEIIPHWLDEDHDEMDSFGRIYSVFEQDRGGEKVSKSFFELYDYEGIHYFDWDGANLHPTKGREIVPYFTLGDTPLAWAKIPLIVFKRNEKESPLIRNVKSLQDAINLIESNFVNVSDQNIYNSILVLVNYDGENLGEFREKLAMYGAIKISTIDGQAGDVKTLNLDVNPENYKAVLGVLKEALVENARAFNVKDNRLNSDANQMHIQTAYHDMDLDADDMEVEWQVALEEMLFFVNYDIQIKGGNIPEDHEVTFTFNRNMMIDESQLIQNCVVSRDIISDETIRSKHPWCLDPQKEKELLDVQKQEQIAYNPIEEIRSAKTTEGTVGGTEEE